MAAVPPENKRILLLDGDRAVREQVATLLAGAGYQVSVASSEAEVLDQVSRRPPDALLVSLDHRDPDRLTTIAELRRRAPGAAILALSDPDRVREGLQALGHGADDYLLRPPDPLELRIRLDRILERRELDYRITFFQDQLSKKDSFKKLEVRSTAMRRVLEQVLRVSPMLSTVLIYGESGVGKELVARLIHLNSPRRDQPFIALNCAAMPASLIDTELFGHEKGAFTGAFARARGKFEIAHRGTLFLDEIAEMAPTTQAKLLRVLEHKEFMRVGGDQSIRVNVRLIAATNADLEQLVRKTGFRRDLYYRLKVVTLTVPPLRERGPDLPALVETFLDELSRANGVPKKKIAPEALRALQSYPWPGNVRELKNMIESALVSVRGEVIRLEDLPDSIRGKPAGDGSRGLAPGMTMADAERELIRLTLEHTGGNRTHSASMLGIGVRTLQRKIRSYDLEISPRRRRPRKPPARAR